MYDDAVKYFEQALRLKKDHPDALEWIARTYEKKNLLPQALNAWNALLRVKNLPEGKQVLAKERIQGIINVLRY